MIDTVIFDFDGTVMNTNRVIMASWQHTYRTITGHEGDETYILSTFGEPLELSLKNAFPHVPVEQSVEIYRDFHRDNFGPMIKPFPGIYDMLEKVKERGYKTGIATSRVRETLEQGLEQYNMRKYFDAIVTVEEVTKHKPDPQMLLKVLKKLNSAPDRAVMLGDTLLDIICAKSAGAGAILVGWSEALAGKTISDFETKKAPDYIIHNPEELFDII